MPFRFFLSFLGQAGAGSSYTLFVVYGVSLFFLSPGC